MNLARLKLVTFDITGTLLQFHVPLAKQYCDIGKFHGVKCDDKILKYSFNTHWKQMKKENPNFGKETGLPWRQWWQQLVFRTFKDGDLNADENKLNLVVKDVIQLYQSADSWQPCYGALELLSYLRNKNIPLGVISNFDPRLPILLNNIKLTHYFKFVLASYDAGFQKPDKIIFDEAIKRSKIKGLKPIECLHIGNEAHVDYFGAINAGWNATLINQTYIFQIPKKYSNVDLNHVYSNLYDLHKNFIEMESKNEQFS